MNDRKAREFKIPLNFLGSGKYRATVYGDDLAAKYQTATRSDPVTAGGSVTLKLVGTGGAMVRLTR
jgi:hypothetical protein